MVVAFHKTCKSLPQAQKITDARKKSINARIKEYGVNEVIEVLKKAEASSFLGKRERWYNFDWIYNTNNFIKIYEGKYDDDVKNNIVRIDSSKIERKYV